MSNSTKKENELDEVFIQYRLKTGLLNDLKLDFSKKSTLNYSLSLSHLINIKNQANICLIKKSMQIHEPINHFLLENPEETLSHY